MNVVLFEDNNGIICRGDEECPGVHPGDLVTVRCYPAGTDTAPRDRSARVRRGSRDSFRRFNVKPGFCDGQYDWLLEWTGDPVQHEGRPLVVFGRRTHHTLA